MMAKNCRAEMKLNGKNKKMLIEFLERIPDYAIASIRTEPYHDQRDPGGTFLVYTWTEVL